MLIVLPKSNSTQNVCRNEMLSSHCVQNSTTFPLSSATSSSEERNPKRGRKDPVPRQGPRTKASTTPVSCITAGSCPPPPRPQQVGCTCDYLVSNESHFVVARPLYYVPNFGSSPPPVVLSLLARRARPPASDRAPVTRQRREWPGGFSCRPSSPRSLSLVCVCRCSTAGRCSVRGGRVSESEL